MKVLITNHEIVKRWARLCLPCDLYLSKISRRQLRSWTPAQVFGQLPVPLAAYTIKCGHTYFHFNLRELTVLGEVPDQYLSTLKPTITNYQIKEISNAAYH